MYNTKCAVRLYVEAAKQSWNMIEYKVRGRSLGCEIFIAVNIVPSSWGIIFQVPSFGELGRLTQVSAS